MCCHDSFDVRQALTTLGSVAETLPGVVCSAVFAGVLTRDPEAHQCSYSCVGEDQWVH